MANYCGKDLLIQIEDPAVPGTFVTIADLRDTSVSINNESVDVTTKTTMSWRQLIDCGVRTMSISGSGVFSDDAALADFVDSVIGNTSTIANYRVISGRGDQFQGAFQATTHDRNGSFNGAEEYSLSLESAGDITYTPAP